MMSFKLFTVSIVFAFTGLVSSTGTAGEDAAAVLKKVDAAGYAKSTRMKVIQRVITPSGDTRTFHMVSYTQNGNEKSLTEYVSPEQVRGMKVLSLRDGNDIWGYFPRTNRVRKMASSARNRKVQGSDFTYDDMAQGKMVKQWKGTVEGEETVEGKTSVKLKLTPTAEGPQSYTQIFMWVDKSTSTPLRIDYYDLDSVLLKRLELQNYKKVDGVSIPHDYVMTNLTDGGKTLMEVVEAEVNVPLDSVLFTETGLGR